MLIIHISGYPASGKTTLLSEIAKLYPWVVTKDTDDFTRDMDLRTERTKYSTEGAMWAHIYKEAFTAFEEEHRGACAIVYAGILNNYLYPFLKHEQFDYRFYLDVPREVLMKQTYRRHGEMSLEWFKTLDNRLERIEGSAELERNAKAELSHHARNGYTVLYKNEILQRLESILLIAALHLKRKKFKLDDH